MLRFNTTLQQQSEKNMPEEVSYLCRGLKISAHLYKPKDFSPQKKYPAVIIGHPASGCKQQTAAIYAKHMRDAGFIALTYDASYQGKSEGQPRHLEDPNMRVEDFRAGIDYLVTLKFVDQGKIGAIGICASGGYVINAAMSERRIKAVATITGANVARIYRENIEQVLADVAKQRTLEARGGEKKLDRWIPTSAEECKQYKIEDRDVLGAVDYYTTPRGQKEGSPNWLYFNSRGLLATWDAFHLAEKLLVQPLQIVVGDKVGAFGAYRDSFDLYDRAASKEKNVHVIKGAEHYDLYDEPKAVEETVSVLVPFFKKHLA